MISLLSLLSLVPYFLAAAATDSAACTSGTCTYQSGDGSNTAWSVLAINAENPTSLSDLTTAAGWDIIECDPHSTGTQDIRLVCTYRSKGCDHLFEGGEEHTIVRLPDSCTGGPFARVVKSQIADDQTVPARLANRQLDGPVHALTLDFDFSQIPVSNGKVHFTAGATNSQAQRDSLTGSAAKRSLEPLRHATRSGLGHAATRDFVEASKKRAASPEQVQNTARDGVEKAGNTTGDVSIDGLFSFKKTISKNFHLIDTDRTFPVFTAALTCPALDAGVFITAAVKTKLDAEVGFIVAGTILPPHISSVAFTSKLRGNVAAAFDVNAIATGTFDTGAIPLYETGLSGLNFPGILAVGPSFSLNAQVKANLGVTANIHLASMFDLPQVELVFPPSQGQSSAQVVPGSTQIRVNVGSSDQMDGHAEAHIIPKLNLNVSILGGLAETNIFLNVDGVAEVDFDLSAGAGTAAVSGTNELPVVALEDVKTEFDGTVGADVGLSINAGTTAALAPFFDQGVSVPIYSRTFYSFKETYGKPPAKRSLLLEEREPNFPGLLCPPAGELDTKQSIIDLDAPAPQQ